MSSSDCGGRAHDVRGRLAGLIDELGAVEHGAAELTRAADAQVIRIVLIARAARELRIVVVGLPEEVDVGLVVGEALKVYVRSVEKPVGFSVEAWARSVEVGEPVIGRLADHDLRVQEVPFASQAQGYSVLRRAMPVAQVMS